MNEATNYGAAFYSENQNDPGFLEKTIREFPVSAVPRFLLLYHHKKNNSERFESLAQQTAIYLNNSSWIEYQLSQIEEFYPDEPHHSVGPLESEEKQTIETDNNLEEKLPIPPEEKLLSSNENKEQLISKPGNGIEEQILPPSEVLTEIPKRTENENNQADISKSDSDIFKIEENEPSDQNQIENENPPENESAGDIIIPEPGNDITSNEENSNPFQEEEETISFEPLHTVDYFASQGIKINEEELANDHLIKQVKSFTAWLKSMKKLHPGQLPEQNEVIEKIIQTSSEASNKDAHVLTEAMAEVLVKQGKREKAIEMYQKLSLINPSKSPYFAAKIESLKTI